MKAHLTGHLLSGILLLCCISALGFELIRPENHDISVQGFRLEMQDDKAIQLSKKQGWIELDKGTGYLHYFARQGLTEYAMSEFLTLESDHAHRICWIDMTTYPLAMTVGGRKISGSTAHSELREIPGLPDEFKKIGSFGTVSLYSKLYLRIWVWIKMKVVYRVQLGQRSPELWSRDHDKSGPRG